MRWQVLTWRDGIKNGWRLGAPLARPAHRTTVRALHLDFVSREMHIFRWVQRTLWVISAMMVTLAGWWSWNSRSVNDEAGAYEQAIARVEAMTGSFLAKMQEDRLAISPEQVSMVREEVAFANQLADKRAFSWTRLLSDLEETIPPQVSLSSVTLNFQESTVVMEGNAAQLQDLNTFIQRLDTHRGFRQAVLDRHELRQGSSGGRASTSSVTDEAEPVRHQQLEFRLNVRYRPLL